MNGGVVVINGSPHPDGNTMALATAVCTLLPGPLSVVHLYEKCLTPCRACMACSTTNACFLRDDAAAILNQCAGAAFLLFASPLHFTSLSAPLIALISRLQPLWRQGVPAETSSTPRRAAGLVLTAGGSYRNMFAPARSVARAAFNTLGCVYAGMATAENTDTMAVDANSQALESAAVLARALQASIE